MALLAVTVAIAAMVAARRWMTLPQAPPQQSVDAEQQAGAGGYADSASCAMCHDAIARTYSLTGMARSFAKLRPDTTPPADFSVRNRLYHDASDRHYTMVERDGTFYQRRHQIGFDGREANSVEFAADYVIGSGNHARTFLHRSADGQLLQLPVSWYAERGGYWAMSPGYDGPAHLDFRRVIDAGCMSCHNGYPRAPVPDADSAPKFGDSLPEGIDCQRCHGPGQAHVEAVKTGALDAARLAIVNPARFDRDRQLETCMQCHLEPTSTPLPFQVRRYEQPPFSFSPGKALGDYFIYFDHAPGSGRDDKFEIAGGAYRLSKSACFQRSQMTCQTCHDPHDIPRGEAAVKRYVAVCQGCHEGTHRSGVPRVQGVGATPTCLDCHMPKRRTEDAVHVVMTDHFIQLRRAAGNLLAEIQETDALRQGDYRGEVALYYPKTLPLTPENELYLALAQVQQGSNLTAGIQRLEQAIEKHRPARPDFYYELARAYSRTANHQAAIRWSDEALRRDATFVPALKELGGAATAIGDMARAAQALEKAVSIRPKDATALADLGNVYLRQQKVDDALKSLERALALDPDLPLANNTMGLASLRKGLDDAGERHLRAAIRTQPDLAEAHNNLGNLLAGRRAYAEAGHHFEQAIRSAPNYVEALHSYGVVLALTRSYPKAVTELQKVVKLAPGLAQAHVDLADVLGAMGRTEEAAREYEIAAKGDDAEARQAALEALRAMGR